MILSLTYFEGNEYSNDDQDHREWKFSFLILESLHSKTITCVAKTVKIS